MQAHPGLCFIARQGCTATFTHNLWVVSNMLDKQAAISKQSLRSSSILRLVWNSYGMQLALPSFLKLGWGFALPQHPFKIAGQRMNKGGNRTAKQALQSKITEYTIWHDPEQCRPRAGGKSIVDKAVMYLTCQMSTCPTRVISWTRCTKYMR